MAILKDKIADLNSSGPNAFKLLVKNPSVKISTFTKEEIAVAEKTFTQEQLAGKSFGEITEMIILAEILGRIQTEKFYGSIATDWEFVV